MSKRCSSKRVRRVFCSPCATLCLFLLCMLLLTKRLLECDGAPDTNQYWSQFDHRSPYLYIISFAISKEHSSSQYSLVVPQYCLSSFVIHHASLSCQPNAPGGTASSLHRCHPATAIHWSFAYRPPLRPAANVCHSLHSSSSLLPDVPFS